MQYATSFNTLHLILAQMGVTLLPSPPRIPLVRQRPACLQSRHLSGSDAATAVKGVQWDRSHTQPQGRLARTFPLTAGGRGGALSSC